MGQHRTFGHPGGAAGILQERQIVGLRTGPIGPHIGAMCAPFGKGGAQPQRRHCKLWHRRQAAAPDLLHTAHDGFGQLGEELGHPGEHHGLQPGLRHHLGQLVGKHVDDNQNLGPGIVDLVDHFRRRIHRVGIDQDAARFEHTKGHHRIGQPVGQLHRHPVAGLQPAVVPQIGGKGIGHRADLGVGQAAIHAVGHHAGEGPPFGIGRTGAVDKISKTCIAWRRQILRDGCAIRRQPRTWRGIPVGHVSSPAPVPALFPLC